MLDSPPNIPRRRIPFPQEVGGQYEIWTLGYMIDPILTRRP